MGRKKKANPRSSSFSGIGEWSSSASRQRVVSYLTSITTRDRRALLSVNPDDLKNHVQSLPPSSTTNRSVLQTLISEALDSAELERSLTFWFCFSCDAKFADCDVFDDHITLDHCGGGGGGVLLSPELQPEATDYLSKAVEGDNPMIVSPADDERMKLLKKIRAMILVLELNHCTSDCTFDTAVDYADDRLTSKSLPKGIPSHELIWYLDAQQLQKLLDYLQGMADVYMLGRYHDQNISPGFWNLVCQGHRDPNIIIVECNPFKLVLECDNFGESSASTSSVPGLDNLVSWLYSGPSVADQLSSWVHEKEEKSKHCKIILGQLKMRFENLNELRMQKSDFLNHLKALGAIRKVLDNPNSAHHGYEELLKKLEEELAGRGDGSIELCVISALLTDTQNALDSQPERCETLSSVASNVHEDDARVDYFIHRSDDIIKAAIKDYEDWIAMQSTENDRYILSIQSEIQLLEINIGIQCALDYRSVLIPLLKDYLQQHLMKLVEEYARKPDTTLEASKWKSKSKKK